MLLWSNYSYKLGTYCCLNRDNKEKYKAVLTKVPDVETENSRGEAFGQ